MYLFASKYANKNRNYQKTVKICPKGFLNDVIGTENLKVWNFFPKCTKFNKEQKLPGF